MLKANNFQYSKRVILFKYFHKNARNTFRNSERESQYSKRVILFNIFTKMKGMPLEIEREREREFNFFPLISQQ